MHLKGRAFAFRPDETGATEAWSAALSTAPQKFLTQCAADAGPDRGASEEHIRRRSVTSE